MRGGKRSIDEPAQMILANLDTRSILDFHSVL